MPGLYTSVGPDPVTYYKLAPIRTLVGRDPSCDIVLRSADVSRYHCTIELVDRQYWVIDHSGNGTRVDGRRVRPGGRLPLRDEEVVWIGGVELIADTTPGPPPGSAAPTNKLIRGLDLDVNQPKIAPPPVNDAEFAHLVGRSDPMREVFRQIRQFGPRDASVLVLGPTGTGKELVARQLHAESARANGPFVPVNCGTLIKDLALSRLFGHLKGSFTGAVASVVGHVEQAHGGTLFLDEIGDLPRDAQVLLLRLLQEGECQPIGAPLPRKVDVRVIAATHRDLDQMVAADTFRADLRHRLSPLVLRLPPLAERREDIPRLVLAILGRHREPQRITGEAIALLQHQHDWPGNVRELENALTAAAAGADGTIEPRHFAHLGWARKSGAFTSREVALAALRAAGTVRQLAKVTKIPRTTLTRMLDALGITAADARATPSAAE